MTDPHPRYIVKEIRGFSSTSGNARQTSDFMVLDRWHCHSVVYYDKARVDRKGNRRVLPYRDRAREADRICLRMNVEHDDWLYARDAA